LSEEVFKSILGETQAERDKMTKFLKENPALLNLFSSAFKLGAWFGFRCRVSGLTFKQVAEGLDKAMPLIDMEKSK
jgi:hypothetical protein